MRLRTTSLAPLPTAEYSPHESVVSIYSPPGGHHAAHQSRWPSWVRLRIRCCRSRRCRRWIFPPSASTPACPGASAQIMAASVATPLERQFSHIAGITEMTSSSSLGNTSVTLQFDLSRNIDGAARDVQAAINAARTYLPTNLPSNPLLSQGEPRRFADHDYRPHVEEVRHHQGLRSGLDDSGAEALVD